MARTPEDLRKLIQDETELIAELEATRPTYDSEVGVYHSNNSHCHQHDTKIRDAYWRRRNWRAYLENPEHDPANNPG